MRYTRADAAKVNQWQAAESARRSVEALSVRSTLKLNPTDGTAPLQGGGTTRFLLRSTPNALQKTQGIFGSYLAFHDPVAVPHTAVPYRLYTATPRPLYRLSPLSGTLYRS